MSTISTTKYGERLRKQEQKLSHSSQKPVRLLFGIIEEVDEKSRNLITVRLLDGSLLSGGRWIRLNNGPLEIIHRVGKLRKGLGVKILYSGDAEQNAIAELSSDFDETAISLLIPNEIDKNKLYGIFQ